MSPEQIHPESYRPAPELPEAGTPVGTPVRIMRSEIVPNSGFVGLEGTYAGISRVAKPGSLAPRVLVVIDGYGPVPFWPEEVLVVGEGTS